MRRSVRTGLHRLRGAELDAFYKVRVRHWPSPSGFEPTRARYMHVVTADPFEVNVLADLRHSGDLHVNLHGAMAASDRYPRFERVTSTTRRKVPFLCIADPTVGLCPGVKLGWYVGTEPHDPTDALLDVVRRAQQVSSASRVVFTGTSGGGFAALRLSTRMPGSVAVVFNPQTRLARYHPAQVQPLLDAAFGGCSPYEAAWRHPTRMSVVAPYRSSGLANVVYYVQNRHDDHHVRWHWAPFAQAVGVPFGGGTSSAGLVRLVLESGARGHVSPTQERFDHHLAHALAFADSVGR